MTQNQNTPPSTSSMPPIAYFLVASGGGVVGHDYARFLDFDPFIGAGLGGIISVIIMNILQALYRDPDGKIREFFSAIGFIGGGIFGVAVANGDSGGDANVFVMGVIFALIGAVLGQLAALALSLVAFALILFSQGPLGLIVRTWILNG